MSESENESQGNYYIYSNKGKEQQFNLDDLTTEELKKFEKMTEKQRLRFIANFELQKESTFQDTISLKPTITEARNEEYNKYALLKQKLDEAEKLGEKLKDYDNYENIELLDSKGNIKDEFNEYFKNINSNDIKNCMAAFDLDNVSVGMLKKYYKKKIEDLHLTGIKTSFLESLKKMFKKFYEIEDEDFKTTKPKVKTTIDRLFDDVSKLKAKSLNPYKTEQLTKKVNQTLSLLIENTVLKNKDSFTQEEFNNLKNYNENCNWSKIGKLLNEKKIYKTLQDLITTMPDIEQKATDIILEEPTTQSKSDDDDKPKALQGDEAKDVEVGTKEEEDEDTRSAEETKESDKKSEEVKETKSEEIKESDKKNIDVNTPVHVRKQLDEELKILKRYNTIIDNFKNYKDFYEKNKSTTSDNITLDGTLLSKKDNEYRGENTDFVIQFKIQKEKPGFTLIKTNKENNKITYYRYYENSDKVIIKQYKNEVNEDNIQFSLKFYPNKKNKGIKVDDKIRGFKYGKGYTPKVKLSFYGKTPEGGSTSCGNPGYSLYKTTYTSGSLVDKLRNRFLKTVNEDIEGLKETDNEFKDSIKNITDKLNELEMMIKSLKVSTSQTQPVIPKAKPSFLDDITSPVKLKPVERNKVISEEPTEIEKILSQRRKDIEYSESESDEEDDEWGEGYGSKKMKLLDFLKSLE